MFNMRNLTLISWLGMFALSAHAESCRSIGEYWYTFGDKESLLEAKQQCEALAIRAAVEECALFVQSVSEIVDFQMKSDLVNTIAIAFVKKKKVLESTVDGRTVYTRVSILLDEEEMKQALEFERSRTASVTTLDTPGSSQIRSQDMTGAPLQIQGAVPGLSADYYNLPSGTMDVPAGTPIFHRVDATINFKWDGAPVPRVNSNWFAVRWTGFIKVDKSGLFSLRFMHDDGLRVWVDGKKVYDHWQWSERRWRSVDVEFTKQGWLPFKAEFMDKKEGAACSFQWALPGEASFEEVLSGQFQHQP